MANLLIGPATVLLVSALIPTWQKDAAPGSPPCRPAGDVVRVSELPEGSGVAASRRTPGLFWAHNDSGDPVLFALDARGAVTARVRVTGADVDDWEDIAVGPCPRGSCVYIADIGDNRGRRERITVYRTPEPGARDAATEAAEAFHATYPNGAHDAEALFVTPGADVFIITKGDPGPVALYRFPRPLTAGRTLQLERVGEPLAAKDVGAKDRPTAADASGGGRWVAVRTTAYVTFYRTADLSAGRWREAFRHDLSALKEPRGEGVTFAANDTVILIGESAGSRGGTFARLECTIER